MYLINIFRKCGILLYSCKVSLFILLGIFTYAHAEVVCDNNCKMTVEFKGVYKEDTCVISINGASNNEIVLLPTISHKTLDQPQKEAGSTLFTVALNNCPTEVEVNLFFKSFANLSTVTENLKNRDGDGFAKNVELRIRDGNEKHIAIDNPNSGQLYDIPAVNSSVTKNYYVSYFAGEDPVSPGNVEAKTVLEVVYK